MRRFKLDLLAPYVSDVVAFAVLGVAIAVVTAVASMNGDVPQASVTYSVLSSGFSASL